jgi:hypothetical protein
MVNPFSGIVTPAMQTMWKQAIEAMIESGGPCACPCDLIYQGTKFSDCPNCIYNAVGNKSANRYQAGGPNPFPNGSLCPVCQGKGKLMPQAVTEDLYMGVFWNYKDWKEFGLTSAGNRADSLNFPEGIVKTLSKIETYSQIMRCTEAILDTSLENYARHRFTRQGEPNPHGLGAPAFIVTTWKRVA